MIQYDLIRKIAEDFGLEVEEVRFGTRRLASEGILDIFPDKYHLISATAVSMLTEEQAQAWERLRLRLSEIGLKAPELLKNSQGNYIASYEKDLQKVYCVARNLTGLRPVSEEYTDDLDHRKEIFSKLGQFAAKFKNVDLWQKATCWSLGEDYDGKQQALDGLRSTLIANEYDAAADMLMESNRKARELIREHLSELPKLVFFGPLDPSILLQSRFGNFEGVKHFSKAGTEVILNYFLNESMPKINALDFRDYTAIEVLNRLIYKQDYLLSSAWKHYDLSPIERTVFSEYRRLVFFANDDFVETACRMLEQDIEVLKLLEVLHLIASDDWR